MLRLLFVTLLALTVTITLVQSQSQQQQQQQQHQYHQTITSATKRTEHVDILDAATLEYYLEAPTTTALDYDVVVMYYATWCTNCKALAPIYEKIAEILQAGTVDSKLIVSYFDCEADLEHATLCSTAGITHYPTIHFYSFAGGGYQLSRQAPKHVSKFPGNWQQGEAILDWIRVMSALSQWHRRGWGQKLRSWVFGNRNRKNNNKNKSGAAAAGAAGNGQQQLPVGIPRADAAERQLQSLQASSKLTQDYAIRLSSFVDVMLFPRNSHPMLEPIMTDALGATYTDVFGYMHQHDLWWGQQQQQQQQQGRNANATTVLRTCLMESALDVCERLSERVTEQWLEAQPISNIHYISEEAWSRFENETTTAVQQQEPYCSIVQNCILTDYKAEECRPSTCPFQDQTACRFVTACLTDSLQLEYAIAMNLELPPGGVMADAKTATTTVQQEYGVGGGVIPPQQGAASETEPEAPAKKRKWGFA